MGRYLKCMVNFVRTLIINNWMENPMKNRDERRIEAEGREKHYKYEDSKAKRLGTKTEDEWNEARNKSKKVVSDAGA